MQKLRVFIWEHLNFWKKRILKLCMINWYVTLVKLTSAICLIFVWKDSDFDIKSSPTFYITLFRQHFTIEINCFFYKCVQFFFANYDVWDISKFLVDCLNVPSHFNLKIMKRRAPVLSSLKSQILATENDLQYCLWTLNWLINLITTRTEKEKWVFHQNYISLRSGASSF